LFEGDRFKVFNVSMEIAIREIKKEIKRVFRFNRIFLNWQIILSN
jgi:hypothetical protein